MTEKAYPDRESMTELEKYDMMCKLINLFTDKVLKKDIAAFHIHPSAANGETKKIRMQFNNKLLPESFKEALIRIDELDIVNYEGDFGELTEPEKFLYMLHAIAYYAESSMDWVILEEFKDLDTSEEPIKLTDKIAVFFLLSPVEEVPDNSKIYRVEETLDDENRTVN